MRRLTLGLLLGIATLGCGPTSRTEPPAAALPPAAPAVAFQNVRAPAVAGAFYPADQGELRKAVDGFLDAAPKVSLGRIRAIVCPHAGYAYSGKTAGHSYKQVQGDPFNTVLVLAASHYADFDGVALSTHDAVETPLGRTAVGPLAQKLNEYRPFRVNPPCRVLNRPAWGQALAAGESPTPITWEHSLEVQFPFIQRALPTAQIVSAVCGQTDPGLVAGALAEVLDQRTLLVVSTDLSHFFPYEKAQSLDRSCVAALCNLDVAAMQEQEACGKTPVLIALHLAQQKHWKAKLLDLCNSGDTAGDKSRVVGYAAVAFYEDASPAQPAAAPLPPKTEISTAQQRILLRLARESITRAARDQQSPQAAPHEITAPLDQKLACFVTLKKAGELRGCIGSILPEEPLHEAVVHRARDAALHDHRFRPVQPEELAQIDVEVSVLTLPQPLPFASPADLLAKLRPNVDGVLLSVQGRHATFLPQVWEQLPNKEEFLAHLSQKAGCAPQAWREPGTQVQIYQVVAFREKDEQ